MNAPGHARHQCAEAECYGTGQAATAIRPERGRAPLSVAVATMNRPEKLRRCLTAILNGRMLPAEIVIVDQSTDDQTSEQVRICQSSTPVPIQYVRQDRRGLAVCRNTAVMHATQPIVAFTDDDCVPDPRWLAALVDAFDGDERPDAVTGCVLPLGPESPGLYPVSTRPSRTRAVYRGRALPWTVGTGGNAAVRREWLDRVKAFDERLGIGSPGQSAEDLDLFYRLLRAGAVVRYEPTAVMFHERQTVEGRLSRAASYSFGMGAVCARWALQRDAYTLWIAFRWCFDRADTLLRACIQRQWWRVREELLTIDGARRGIAYGLALVKTQRATAASEAPTAMGGGRSFAASREADWRFLLPPPPAGSFEHLVLLGGSESLANTVLDLGVARRVTTSVSVAADADALVVLAGAQESIETALRSLRPDGVLYWEVDRRRRRQLALTPARAKRRLRRSAFSTSTTYWVKPGFPERQMYLPIGATGALHWYLDTLYRSSSRGRRLLKGGLRALTRHSRALAAVAPCYALTAARGRSHPGLIESAWHRGAGRAGAVEPVFLAHGTAEWNRLAVMLFAAQAPSPAFAVKLPRRATFNEHVEREHTFLRETGARLPDALRQSLPSSYLLRWDDLAVSVQSCVPGASLGSRTGGTIDEVLDDLHVTAQWLADFHQATTLETVPAHQWLAKRLIGELCTEYEATFGLTDAERQLFATLARRLDSAGGGMLPIVWQHTDFGPSNIYRDGSRISVIDWEVSRRGPAVVDAIYFAAEWSTLAAATATRDQRDRHFASLFCESAGAGTLIQGIHRELAEYMRRLNVAPSLLPFLVVYTFLEQVLDRADRFAALNCADASGHAANRYVRCLRIVAQHARTLFPEEARHAA